MIVTTVAQDASSCQSKEDDEQSLTSQDAALMEILGLRSPYLGDSREEDVIHCKDHAVHNEGIMEPHHHHPYNPAVAEKSTIRNPNVFHRIKLPIHVSRHFYSPEECLAIQYPNLLSSDECQELIALASPTLDYIRHAVHIAPDGTQLTVELQNPNRHKLSVFYHEKWVELLWNRLKPKLFSQELLAPFLRREDVSLPTGLNPRLRVLKYDAIDKDEFIPHFDATTRVGGKISLLTVLLYLNSGGGQDFQGGETCYLTNDVSLGQSVHENKTVVIPQVGSVVIFEHDLYHAGNPLEWGTKYVLRTDVLFDISEEEWEARPIKAAQGKINDVSNTSLSRSKSLPPATVYELILSTSNQHRWTVDDQSLMCDALEALGMLDLTIESFCAPGRFALQMILQDSLRSMSLDNDVKVLVKQVVDNAFISLARS